MLLGEIIIYFSQLDYSSYSGICGALQRAGANAESLIQSMHFIVVLTKSLLNQQ